MIHRAFLQLLAVASLATAGCSSNPNPVAPVQTASPLPQARLWKSTAGASSRNEALQALAFYPATITIDAGDSIQWTAPAAEPHTISFPISGQAPLPPTDPTATLAEGGSSYDGSAYVSSGFIGSGQTYTLSFPKPGTYTYYSLPQEPIVAGTVVVQVAGAPYPATQSAYDSAAAAAENADETNALASVSSIVTTTNTIAAGVSPTTAGGATSTVMRFLSGPTLVDDENVTISAGTTLTFKNMSNNVPHTVTFPALGGSLPSGPPFQPAAGGNTYDGSGLVNSGAIPPGGSFSLTFTRAGTYPYYCLFHNAAEGMVATVTVI